MMTHLAVVDAGSLSAASRRLRVPLATVSRRVALLEEELGARLRATAVSDQPRLPKPATGSAEAAHLPGLCGAATAGASGVHRARLSDPMVGQRIGGRERIRWRSCLYSAQGRRVGALGVSGDSSWADHNIAWRVRHAVALDYVPAGVSPAKDDNIVFLGETEAANGFKHPLCGGTEPNIELPPIRKP